MKTFLHILLFLGIAAVAHAGHGHTTASPRGVAASAAFDSSGTLWAVHQVGGHLVVSRSSDRGKRWGSPVMITTAPEKLDAGGDARPKIVIGRGNEIFVTWTRALSRPFAGEIRFSRSVDGGRTFSEPLVVHQDRQEITHRFDALAVNSAGRVFVAWIDKRDQVAATQNGQPYAGAAIYFAVSDDQGASFRGDFKVAEHCCECCRIALAPGSDGSVIAMWRHIFPPNIRDHALAVLQPDGGCATIERASFEDWRIDGCPHHGPGLAIDSAGNAHAVWFSGEASQAGVFYGRPGAGGISGLHRIESPRAMYADIGATQSSVAVAWCETHGAETRLQGMSSTDGGRSWLKHDLATATGSAAHPQVIAFKDQLYVFWHTADHPLRLVAFPPQRRLPPK